MSRIMTHEKREKCQKAYLDLVKAHVCTGCRKEKSLPGLTLCLACRFKKNGWK
jgi:hypothetical protein